MRGKGWTSTPFLFPYGITPAYAGKRKGHQAYSQVSWDHPRLCGEKSTMPTNLAAQLGSPPPMRGKGNPPDCCPCHTGITPAYAGKSVKHCPSLIIIGDHPRLCGEKDVDCKTIASEAGSPPPMRGKAFSPSATG